MKSGPRAFSGAASGVFGYGLQVASQVLVIPIVLATAGWETMGAYAALMQLISYLGFIDIGFGSAAYWFLASATGRDDDGQQFRYLLARIRSVLFMVNTGFAVLVILTSTHLHFLLSLSGNTAISAKYGLFCLAIWAIAKTPMSTYAMALRSTQHLAEANTIAVIGNAVRLVAILPLLKAGMGVLALILANLLGDAVTTIAQGALFMRKCPALRPLGTGAPPILRQMFSFGVFALLANSGYVLIVGTDNMVVSKLFGPASAAVYYTTYAPAQVIWQVLFRIPSSAGPGLAELAGANNFGAIAGAHLRLFRYGILLSVPAALCLLGLHQKIISIWVGPQQYAGQLMTVSLAIVIALAVPNAVCGTVLTSIGAVRKIAVLVLAEGVVNLGLSLTFAKWYGLQGVAMGTAAGGMLFFSIYLCVANATVGVGWQTFFSEVLRPILVPLSIATPGAILLTILAKHQSVLAIPLVAVLCVTWVGTAIKESISPSEREGLRAIAGRARATLMAYSL